MKVAIILGTSRTNGNTHQLVNAWITLYSADIFNLEEFSFYAYDYEHKNANDDFDLLIKTLITYEHIIFATPVYWYTMSAQMKLFFDRLSDLLTIKKEIGRALKGKSCSILSTGANDYLPEGFEQPFMLTAKYLGMVYKEVLYCKCSPDFDEQKNISKIQNFINDILT